MQLLTQGQQIVLQHHFSEYPENKNFEEIVKMIREGDTDEIGIWCAFEEWSEETFLNHIISLANDINEAINSEK